jgi:N-acetylmuramoyl-L-alanine amidase
MAASAPKKVTKVGDYEVVVGGSSVAFWPLVPGTTLTQAMPPLVCAPNDPTSHNTAFVPVLGIFDVVIRMSDEVKDERVDEPLLLNQVAGKATLKKVPLVREANGDVPICFAVDQSKVAEGASWEGILRLTAPQNVKGTKQNRTIELNLNIKRMSREPRLFVFFPVHKKPKKTYAWIRLKAVDAADGTTPVSGAMVKLKVLRDNFQSGFTDINREVELTTEAGGYLQHGTDRVTIGVPVEWPLILHAEAGGFVPRGHMLRIADAESKKDQGTPFLPPVPLRMTRTANAKLAGKKIMFDPGHGVAYALAKQRRSQEWFVAHKLADRIADILVAEYGVVQTDISWTKTAGFGLIEPGHVHSASAPEDGRKRFKLDLPNKRIAAKLAAVRLDDVASLLITRHQGNADAAVAPSEADWNAWLTRQITAIKAIVARVDQGLSAQHQRVRPGSVRWHVTSHRYVYTQERINPAPNQNPMVADHVNLPLALTDWFALDPAAFDLLADRTARWALECEIGGDAAFQTRARAAMKAAGALAYMKDCVLRNVNVNAPHPYLTQELGWGPNDRRDYFNNHGGSADLILTLHENASSSGKGGMVLVGRQDPPPDDEVRIAKIFIKYLDPFDQGLRQGGITMPDAGKGVGLLDLANTRRAKYAYFESEFMDAPDPNNNTHYRYEEMTTAAFLERTARQIVHGIVEILLDRQSDLDPVTYNTGTKIKNLW